MNLPSKLLLQRLGNGESIASVCQAASISREQFDHWWSDEARSRIPSKTGLSPAAVGSAVTIERDRWGLPHIYAENQADLFFGFGYAMAQDRLFQLDYLRRKGLGRLSEILGQEGFASDLVARTVGLNRIAAARWQQLSPEVRQVLQSFSDGVNTLIEHSGDRLPIEFDLLDYRPQPWTPVDSLAIECEFQWYLTGRFPVIVIPELAKRTLGAGPLYNDFVLGEADEESILHRGEYAPRARSADGQLGRMEPVGQAANDPDASVGSNNWVLASRRTTTGAPLVASDPHIAIEAVSCWYEAHLCGGPFNVVGMAYVGMPAIMFGRTERVAWGNTNNICSIRDLYQERTDPSHSGCFLFDGQWEPARQLEETIEVRGGEPVKKTIRFSRNGPVVDEVLPPPADRTGPVTLKWLGAHAGGWLEALLAMDRAEGAEQFREALRGWHVPTFCVVFADTTGHIGYHATGRIPVRKLVERGYRPGWDREHEWQGLIPFEAMPNLADPPRGWIATANNRPAPDDYPYPLSGCWSGGWRAERIRQIIESRERHSLADMRDMHHDVRSLRAARFAPALVQALKQIDDPQVRQAVSHLEQWNFDVSTDSVAATLFNVFFTQWCYYVAKARFAPEMVELMAAGIAGIATRLLEADSQGWFPPDRRQHEIAATFRQSLDLLAGRFGPDIDQWAWGRLHIIPQRHVLASRGELAQLLNQGGVGVKGDIVTVCNTGSGPDWTAATGAGYRLIADLSTQPPALLAVDCQSQSGHPGDPHYRDQFEAWASGEYHTIHLDKAEAAKSTVSKLTLLPDHAAT